MHGYNREEELATTAELVPVPRHGTDRDLADNREALSRPVSAAPGVSLAGAPHARYATAQALDGFPDSVYPLSSTHPPAASQRRPYGESPERSLYSPIPPDTTLPPPSWRSTQHAHRAPIYSQAPSQAPYARPEVPATPPYTPPRAQQHHSPAGYAAAHPSSAPHSGQSGKSPSPAGRPWQHAAMQADYRPSSPPETLHEISPGASYAISDVRHSGGPLPRGVRASGSSSGASPLQTRLENQVRDLERYNHSLEKRVRDLGQELREVQEHSYSIQAQLQRCQEVLGERDAQVARVTGERDELSLRLQEREAFITSQEHALQELVQSRDHLKHQQAQLQDVMHDSHTQAETSLKKMEGYNERLERMLSEACRERDAALQKIEEILADMKELHGKFEESQADNQKMARLLVSLGKDRDEQKDTVETLRKRVDGLTRDLTDAQSDLDSALQDAAKAEDYAVKHARSAAELQARLDAAERSERRNRDLIDDLQRANDELQSLRARRERGSSRAPSPPPAARHAWEDERPLPAYAPRYSRIDDAPVRRSLETVRDPPYRGVHAHAGPSDVDSFAGSYRKFLEDAPANRASYERLSKLPQRPSPEHNRAYQTPPRGKEAARPLRDSPELLPSGPLAHSDLQRLEGMLLNLNLEKDQLTAEYDKMPTHGGRTLAQRQRKSELEARLSDIDKEISHVRLALKKKGYR